MAKIKGSDKKMGGVCKTDNLCCAGSCTCSRMKMTRKVNFLTGLLVLGSVLLGHYMDPFWFWIAAFMGAGLMAKGLTGFCLAEKMMACWCGSKCTGDCPESKACCCSKTP
jgi:hypothetical protein